MRFARVTLSMCLVGYESALADVESDCLLEDGAQGIAACTAAIAARPNVKKNYVYRSAKYSDAKLFDLATQDAKRALELDPMSAGAHAVLAKVLSGQKNYDQAIVEAAKAIQLDPKMAGGYFERAVGHLAKQHYDLAIGDLSKIIAFDRQMAPVSTFAEAYAFRAIAHSCLGAFDRAIADATQALQRSPQFVMALLVRAAAYRATGDVERAADDQNSAASLQSSLSTIGSDPMRTCPAA